MATALDWTTSPSRGAPPSGVQPVAVAPAAERLEHRLRWLEDAPAAAHVVAFVRGALERLADADGAAQELFATAHRASSSELRAAALSLAYAVRAWQRNVIDCIDELALTDHESLSGWTSVREYSAVLVLAYIAPALAAIRDHGLVARDEGIDVEGLALDFEAMLARVSSGLAVVRPARAEHTTCAPLVAW
jgi:hypothetical protein